MSLPRTRLGDPNDPRHGTRTGYRYGCRCDDCRDANAAWQRGRVQANLRRVADGTATVPHGTTGAYTNYGCRCQACRDAFAAYTLKRRQERVQLLAEGVDVPHGVESTYFNWGCRCPACRAAHATGQSARDARRRACQQQAGAS